MRQVAFLGLGALGATCMAQEGGADRVPRWTFTPLYTYSGVDSGRDDWHKLDLDLLYKASPKWLFGGNVDWRERFGLRDTRYTASVYAYPLPELEVFASVGVAPDADFSPKRVYHIDANWRVWRPISVLFGYREIEFSGSRLVAEGDLHEWRYGATVWFSEWDWLTGRYTDGNGFGSADYFAYSVRYDHVFASGQQLSLSFAHGTDPEREPAVEEVFLTKADYLTAVLRWPLRPRLDLIVGVEYEDREDVYDRIAATVGVSFKF